MKSIEFPTYDIKPFDNNVIDDIDWYYYDTEGFLNVGSEFLLYLEFYTDDVILYEGGFIEINLPPSL